MGVQKYNSGVQVKKSRNSDISSNLGKTGFGTVLYQNGLNNTSETAQGSSGQLLKSNGSSAPTWTNLTGAYPGLSAVEVNYVALPSGSSLTTASFSADSLNWIPLTLPAASWVAAAYGNGVYVALSSNTLSPGIAAYSYNGVDWFTTTLPGVFPITDVTYGNGIFVASVSGSTSNVLYSTNGTSWIQASLPATGIWSKPTYGKGRFVMAMRGSTTGAYSSNGFTWTVMGMPSAANWNALGYGNGTYVALALGGTAAASSTDGITWTARVQTNKSWNAVSYGAGIFTAVSNGTTSGAMTSSDGATWTARTMPSNRTWTDITFDNGKFTVVGLNYNTALTSANGVSWSYNSLGTNYNWSSVASAPAPLPPRLATGEVTEALTGDYTLLPNDRWVNFAAPSNAKITLPLASNAKGREVVIKQTGAGTIDNSYGSSVKPLGSQTAGAAILTGAGKYAKLVSDGTHWIIMEAN